MNKAAPTITTNASATVVLGAGTVHDTATLAGGVSPTGTITVQLVRPERRDLRDRGRVHDGDDGRGERAYASASYTPSAAGTYRWTASYGGDTNNNGVSEACNGTNESVVVSPASPTISTVASGGVIVGVGSVSDTATLAGGVSPTGTITFNLYGPNDATCATAAVFTTTKPVTGNGSYTSANYTPTAGGTYRWTASYGGDADNNAVSEACNGTNESVTVTPATPAISITKLPASQTIAVAPRRTSRSS